MAYFEIRYYMLIHNKDDIEFVTEFPCFLGHPVHFWKGPWLSFKNLSKVLQISEILNINCNFKLVSKNVRKIKTKSARNIGDYINTTETKLTSFFSKFTSNQRQALLIDIFS